MYTSLLVSALALLASASPLQKKAQVFIVSTNWDGYYLMAHKGARTLFTREFATVHDCKQDAFQRKLNAYGFYPSADGKEVVCTGANVNISAPVSTFDFIPTGRSQVAQCEMKHGEECNHLYGYTILPGERKHAHHPLLRSPLLSIASQPSLAACMTNLTTTLKETANQHSISIEFSHRKVSVNGPTITTCKAWKYGLPLAKHVTRHVGYFGEPDQKVGYPAGAFCDSMKEYPGCYEQMLVVDVGYLPPQ